MELDVLLQTGEDIRRSSPLGIDLKKLLGALGEDTTNNMATQLNGKLNGIMSLIDSIAHNMLCVYTCEFKSPQAGGTTRFQSRTTARQLQNVMNILSDAKISSQDLYI